MIKVEVEVVEEVEEVASAILTAGAVLQQPLYIANRNNNVTEIQFNK